METLTQHSSNIAEYLKRTEVTDSENKLLDLDLGILKVINCILEAKRTQKKVIVFGNGGSAAIAQHTYTDLTGALGVRSMTFTDPSLLTAFANDHGYKNVYDRQVKLWSEKNDVIIAISSSGESENILLAAESGKKNGVTLITLSGFQPGNVLRTMGNFNVYVPAEHYGVVETVHSIMMHFITDKALEKSKYLPVNTVQTFSQQHDYNIKN